MKKTLCIEINAVKCRSCSDGSFWTRPANQISEYICGDPAFRELRHNERLLSVSRGRGSILSTPNVEETADENNCGGASSCCCHR